MVPPDSGQAATKCAPDAEVLDELNVETRIAVAYEARKAAVDALLPEGWTATPPQAGPWPGANVIAIFTDRLLVQNADDTPMGVQATNQLAVIAVPVQSPATGSPGVMIVLGFSAVPEGAPGPYGVFVPAEATVERSTRLCSGAASANEAWSFADGDGHRLDLRVGYSRGVPNRTTNVPTRAFSGADPTFYRVYCADQGAYLLRSQSAGVDRVTEFEFSATGPQLGPVFNGSERLVSIVAVPWTVRGAYLPGGVGR